MHNSRQTSAFKCTLRLCCCIDFVTVFVLFSAFKICEVNILTCRYCSYLRWAKCVYMYLSIFILSNYGYTEMF